MSKHSQRINILKDFPWFFSHQFDVNGSFLQLRYFYCRRLFLPDAPKILGSVTVYTWEGNPANISCEILAHPSDVSIMWLRDGLQLPNANSTNIKIYTTPTASYLQVKGPSLTLGQAYLIVSYTHKHLIKSLITGCVVSSLR